MASFKQATSPSPPGRSTLDIPFPLQSADMWTRLRYQVTPAPADAREFPPASGTLALPQDPPTTLLS